MLQVMHHASPWRAAGVSIVTLAVASSAGCQPSPYKHGGQHSNPQHGPIKNVRYNVDLPEPVAAAFAREFPGAKKTAQRAITHTSGAEHFEILYIDAEGKARVVEFERDGTKVR